MKITKQEILILSAFVVVVAVVAGGMIMVKLGADSGPASVAVTPDDTASAEVEEILALDTVSTLLDEQRIDAIVRSGAFGEPEVETAGQIIPVTYSGTPVQTTRVVEVRQPEPQAGPTETYTGPTGPEIITVKLDAVDVAITGVVLGGNTAKALVYSNSEEKGRWINVPGEAYGYEVEFITMRGAVLHKDGRQYVLLLGSNKKSTADYAVAGAGSSGPSPGDAQAKSDPYADMPPEARAQMMEMKSNMGASYQGRRGGGGYGGGRGGGGRGGGGGGGSGMVKSMAVKAR